MMDDPRLKDKLVGNLLLNKNRASFHWENNIFCPNCGNKVNQAESQKVEQRRQRTIPVHDDIPVLRIKYLKRKGHPCSRWPGTKRLSRYQNIIIPSSNLVELLFEIMFF